MKLTFILGLLVMQTLTVIAQVPPDPRGALPGTREYFSNCIEGRYRYWRGSLVPVSRSSTVSLRGSVVQVAGTNEVIVRISRRMPSGAKKWEYAVLRLHTLDGITAEQKIATNVVQDGFYRCVFAAGLTNTLPGYKLPENQRTITFDEYLEVYKKEGQMEPSGQVESIERISDVSHTSSLEETQRQIQKAILDQKTSSTTTRPPLTGEALQNHLKQYQMALIRAGKAPLPMELTPEMEAQLIKEGVLLPTENTLDVTANEAAESALGVETAPQPQR